MPLFRIMGGPSRSNSSNNSNNSSGSNPAPSQPPAHHGRTPSVSRYTYPGQRVTASEGFGSSNYNVTQSLPASMGSSSSSSNVSQQQQQQQQQQHVILRGSSIHASLPPVVSPQSSIHSSSALAPSLASASTTTTTTSTSQPQPSRPGAYQVTRTISGPAQVYRVTVPQGVRPGAEFTVHAGPRRVRVRCPPTSSAGQSLQITLPPEPETHHVPLRMAPLTWNCCDDDGEEDSATATTGIARSGGGGSSSRSIGGGVVPMTPDVRRVNQQAQACGGTAQTFLVTIPPNIYPGMTFTVNVSGQRFLVTCPPTAGPNQKVRIVPPVQQSLEPPEAAPTTQVFEVAVPPNVQAGQPFALMANGQRVLVTCPPNVTTGQKIRFQLPVKDVVGNIKLNYESCCKEGWTRTIRVSDLKFQWVRLEQKHKDDVPEDGDGAAADDDDSTSSNNNNNNNNGVLPVNKSMFDFTKSAYVRKLVFLEGNDARMRTGTLELVPASDAVVDSKLQLDSRMLISYADIASIQGKGLEEKIEWFQRICTQLTLPWEDGHAKLIVRRSHLLLDSVDAVMSLGRDDMRKRWRIEFLGEPAVEAGGLTREWFELVTEQVYDPAFGLWKPSLNNQMCLDINPASGISCPDDHLVYFRFLGRLVGRALFDRQLIKGHMTRTIYRHLLGWPVTFQDIENQDEDYYKSLKKLSEMSPEAIPNMCLDFTVTEEHMGAFTDQELVEGGKDREVNSENLAEYLELNLKHRLMGRTKAQLTELLLGFFDVIPEPALTIFDANELELILCGLPVIDMEDWKANTLYSGLFSNKALKDQVVDWFWEIVTEEFDTEMKARLLQFVTGTSGVPSRGFSVLQGIDGNIKKFTIHGVELTTSAYPRAHTCFNRIDLPIYSSKKELHEKLRTTITLCGVGFDME